MILIENLSFYISGKKIFDNAGMNFGKDAKVGLIGPNGTGKTTLFKLISGEYQADSGSINVPNNYKIGYIRQELPTHYDNLVDLVLSFNKERDKLFSRLETEDIENHAEIYEELIAKDYFNSSILVESILFGLGFDLEMQKKNIKEFSGGWRIRVAMAGLLFTNPEILLLDEPTNHLDFEAISWLEEYIKKYKGMVLVISHDQHFLDNTVQYIAELDQQKIFSYTGNYRNYVRLKNQRISLEQSAFHKQEMQKKKMMQFVERFKAKATKARQAQSRIKMIERMTLEAPLITDNSFNFTFENARKLAPPIATADKVSIGYADAPNIIRNINFSIGPEDRIAILGANGNGKSTLVKFIIGDEDVVSDKQIIKQYGLKIGYFAQHISETIDPNETAFSYMQYVAPNWGESRVRALLGNFGFDKSKADNKISNLSGGEKSRLVFAYLQYMQPDFLILDEPTNHLDMEAKQALADALNNYGGAVIIISHDFNFIEQVADQLWIVENKTCKEFNDDLDMYKEYVIKTKIENSKPATSNKSENKKKISTNLSDIEKEISKLSKERKDIEIALSKKFSELDSQKLENINQKITALEEQWINNIG